MIMSSSRRLLVTGLLWYVVHVRENLGSCESIGLDDVIKGEMALEWHHLISSISILGFSFLVPN